MPAKRRTPKNRDHPITPEAVAAFVAADETALRQLWKLRPWQWPSPIDAIGPCPYAKGTSGAEWWPLAQELRAELVEAAGCDPCL